MGFDSASDSGPCGQHGSFSLDLSPPFAGLLDSCVEILIEMSGRENVVGILLGGSFALGEGGVGHAGARPRLFGDIDLIVAVPSLQIHERLYRMRKGLGAACEASANEIECSGSIDVGVMLVSDFDSMRPSPFVYDLKHHGAVLYGDGGLLDRIPEYDAGEIGGYEAIALLQNRIVSLLGSFQASRSHNGEDPYALLYEISKVYTDICVAALCMSRLYTPGYAARCERLREAFEAGSLSLPISSSLIESIEGWTSFKLSPSALIPGIETTPDAMRRLWDSAAGDALEWLSRCASSLEGRKSESQRGGIKVGVQSGRPGAYGRENFRAWRQLTSSWTIWRRLVLSLGLGTKMLSSNPIGVVHEWGIELLERYVRTGTAEKVERPPGGYPHSGGSWEQAAKGVTEAWMEIVHGAKDGQ